MRASWSPFSKVICEADSQRKVMEESEVSQVRYTYTFSGLVLCYGKDDDLGGMGWRYGRPLCRSWQSRMEIEVRVKVVAQKPPLARATSSTHVAVGPLCKRTAYTQ